MATRPSDQQGASVLRRVDIYRKRRRFVAAPTMRRGVGVVAGRRVSRGVSDNYFEFSVRSVVLFSC